jgi:hypothetical protein
VRKEKKREGGREGRREGREEKEGKGITGLALH